MKRRTLGKSAAGLLGCLVVLPQVGHAVDGGAAPPSIMSSGVEGYNNTAPDIGRFRSVIKRTDANNFQSIDPNIVKAACSDNDGCQIRIGVHDAEGKGLVQAFSITMYYNTINRNWRTDSRVGTDRNAVNEVVFAFGPKKKPSFCAIYDGEYNGVNWTDVSEGLTFSLPSKVGVDCMFTIID